MRTFPLWLCRERAWLLMRVIHIPLPHPPKGSGSGPRRGCPDTRASLGERYKGQEQRCGGDRGRPGGLQLWGVSCRAEGSAHLPSSVGSMTPCQRRGGFEKVLEKGISAHFTIKVEVTSAAPAPGRPGASDRTVSQRLQVTAVTHPVLGGS